MKYNIGIGVITHNRNEIAKKTISFIKKNTPGATIVIIDDASIIPFKNSTFRFNNNVGIAAAQNKCLELLHDCDYIFLFNDDCYPIKKDWHLKYIEASIKTNNHHFSFTFDRLIDGKSNGNNITEVLTNGLISYRNPCGCMLFFTNKCLEVAGGFDPIYNRYGGEHADISNRIFNNKLTSHRYLDIENSIDLFYSYDYQLTITSTVTGNEKIVNRGLRKSRENSKQFVSFMEQKNIVLAAYFDYTNDPQRGTRFNDLDGLNKLIQSVANHNEKVIIFHNGNIAPIDHENIQTIEVKPDKRFAPNVYRWIIYYDYLTKNKYDNVFCVDSTDVEMLKNPFRYLQDGAIYVGNEYNQTIDNKWMQSREPHGVEDYKATIEAHGREALINCGIIGGRYGTVMPLIKKLSYLHKKYSINDNYSTDMAIFVYAMLKYFKDKIIQGEQINTRFKKFEYNNVSWFRHK